MKRLFASIMLTLFLLNVLGYYGVYQGLIAKSSRELSQQLDTADDAVGETVSFKIPLSVPYAVDSREYESATGRFSYEGEVYQLVKQKLYKDTLYLVGVKDVQSSMWSRAMADYVMTFSDTSDESQDVPVSQQLIKDFISVSISLHTLTSGWVAIAEPGSATRDMVPTFCVSVIHPPERG